MKKSIIVTVYVDNVDLEDVVTLQDALEATFEEYEDKRITMQIQDTKLVRPTS